MYTNKGWIGKLLLALLIGSGLGFPFSAKASNGDASTQTDRLFSNVTQIEAGQFGGFAVKEDGTAWGWGGYKEAEGQYAATTAFTPIKLPIDNVLQISKGDRFSLYLKKDGTVWSAGANEHGQLGNGQQSSKISSEPAQIKGLTDIKAVSAGGYHSLAIDRDGKLWAWGGNDQGQLGLDSLENVFRPVQIEGLPSIVAIAAGDMGSIALGNGGEIWSWGHKKYIANAPDEVRKPVRLPGTGEFAAIADDGVRGVALSYNGTVWTWSNYSFDESNEQLIPVQIPGLSDIVAISTHTAVKSDGTVWQWMSDDKNGYAVTQVQGIEGAVKAVDGQQHHYVLLKDGHVMSWGQNFFGNTGIGILDEWIYTPQFITNSITIRLNGKEIDMATSPLIVNQVTYVPLRGIFEKMDVKLKWDVPTRSVIATKGETSIILNSVTGQTTVNGTVIPSDQKPISLRGSMMVPLRLIGETMGAGVKWDSKAYSVNIEYR